MAILTRIKSTVSLYIYTVLSRTCQNIPMMRSLSTHEASITNPPRDTAFDKNPSPLLPLWNKCLFSVLFLASRFL